MIIGLLGILGLGVRVNGEDDDEEGKEGGMKLQWRIRGIEGDERGIWNGFGTES